jgi:hypothetical protein
MLGAMQRTPDGDKMSHWTGFFCHVYARYRCTLDPVGGGSGAPVQLDGTFEFAVQSGRYSAEICEFSPPYPSGRTNLLRRFGTADFAVAGDYMVSKFSSLLWVRIEAAPCCLDQPLGFLIVHEGLSGTPAFKSAGQSKFPRMYGPPHDCKGKAKGRSTDLRKCIRPLCGERRLLAMMSCAAYSS